jgi:ATP synthase H subunit
MYYRGGGPTKKIEALERIKQVEEEVAKLLQKAKREKEQMLVEARRESLEIQEHTKREAEEDYARIIVDEERRARTEREEILERGRRVAHEYKETSEGHIMDAVRLLKERVEEELDHV